MSNESNKNGFTQRIESIDGAPAIDFLFHGDTARAVVEGVSLYAESESDERATLRVTDADGVILADVIVLRRSHRSMTENVTDIGSALLWSHLRWRKAQTAVDDSAPATRNHTPVLDEDG